MVGLPESNDRSHRLFARNSGAVPGESDVAILVSAWMQALIVAAVSAWRSPKLTFACGIEGSFRFIIRYRGDVGAREMPFQATERPIEASIASSLGNHVLDSLTPL